MPLICLFVLFGSVFTGELVENYFYKKNLKHTTPAQAELFRIIISSPKISLDGGTYLTCGIFENPQLNISLISPNGT